MNILVYGDSMSWGIIPGSRNRQPRSLRWPGVMQQQLGSEINVIEECLNGRTTHFDDPNRPKRNGLEYVQMILESHSPIDLIVVMLGINDFQDAIAANAIESAAGYKKLISRLQTLKPEPIKNPARILAIVPPDIVKPLNTMAYKFSGYSRGYGAEARYIDVLKALDAPYIRASNYITLSRFDGVHLDTHGHRLLGQEVAKRVTSLMI